MSRKVLAIANYRVSSDEQLKNGSLDKQKKLCLKKALELDVVMHKSWSGSVSSKKWSNLDRDDIDEMLQECKKNPAIKYAIFDELDRFMRSMLELAHFIVEFKKLGVTVVFASQPTLNTNTASDTLILMLEAFKAEGSNEERQRKSISGHNNALGDGRYTFHPKAGYKKGVKTGIPEIHEVRGPALRKVLVRIATKVVTPTQGLIELNNSDYTKTRAPLKMDKFRKKAIDPFYAGIVEIDKQVKVKNPDGKHEPLISLDHHYALIDIFSNKKKTQSGPLKDGNPDFPCNNIVSCDLCTDKTNGRYVGYKHSNGRNPNLVYEKYRCRSCGRYLSRQELHEKVTAIFDANPITKGGLDDLNDALGTVWKQEEKQSEQDIARIKNKIIDLKQSIENQVEAVTDPSNASIKQDILGSINIKKDEVTKLEDELKKLSEIAMEDELDFLRFAFGFVENMGKRFLELPKEDRLWCKQLVFPAGFYLDETNKVYTPEISSLIRLEKMDKVQMVRVMRL